MPITVAWEVETNALPRAQSVKLLVLLIVGMKHQIVDVKDSGFLVPETEIVAMTLTPPWAGKTAPGIHTVERIGNRSETNRIRIGYRSNRNRTTIE